MFFNEDHLRVTKTKTIDGVNPIYDDQKRPVKKVVHLPLAAKRYIEEQNALLPTQIKMDIQVMRGYTPAPVENVENEELKKRIAELETQLQEKKIGRPKKSDNENNA